MPEQVFLGIFRYQRLKYAFILQHQRIGSLNVERRVSVGDGQRAVACLVPNGYRIHTIPQHIGYTCILQGVILEPFVKLQVFLYMMEPVVAKLLLRPRFLAWLETFAEEVAATMGAEDVKVDHQFGHLLGHGDGNRIPVLGLILMQRYRAFTYIYIAHAHAREFLWPDTHIMREIAGQQKMPIVLLKIVAYLEHHVIRNDRAFLGIALDSDVREPGTRILMQVTSLEKVSTEGS